MNSPLRRLPHARRTLLGTVVVGIGANLVGAAVVLLLVLAVNVQLSDRQTRLLVLTSLWVILGATMVGTLAGMRLHRRTVQWLTRGIDAGRVDARRALRVPFDVAVISAVVWTLGTVVVTLTLAANGVDGGSLAGIALGVALAGTCSVGVAYLMVGYVTRPVARTILAAFPPGGVPLVSVTGRLLLIWGLTTGVPVLGIALILAAPSGSTDNMRPAGVVLAAITVVVGAVSTGIAARGLGQPLRSLVGALQRIGEGDLAVEVRVEDPGEVGRVQRGVNEMVQGLRERERIQDLFGRHVGPAVAQQALERGVTLSGEQLEAVALFVDITGSTRLTHANDPQRIVAMLNRFFAIVVEAVEANGGLLNKFEGDGALCVFGAPVPLPDAPSRALRAAREIRDGVLDAGEVSVGIGVALGTVVAGQIGSPSRLEYTVIGDAVNEAARLTDLAKTLPGQLVASEAAVAGAAAEEAARWTAAGEARLRGRTDATKYYTA